MASGADVNERSHEERETPLMVAAKYGHLPLLDFLIKMDAHANYVNDQGQFGEKKMRCREYCYFNVMILC